KLDEMLETRRYVATPCQVCSRFRQSQVLSPSLNAAVRINREVPYMHFIDDRLRDRENRSISDRCTVVDDDRAAIVRCHSPRIGIKQLTGRIESRIAAL